MEELQTVSIDNLIDYTYQILEIKTLLQAILALVLIFMIIKLCHYAYKFFNMFFK